MYPENPEETQVIVGSMNMGYISDTAGKSNSQPVPSQAGADTTRPQDGLTPHLVPLNPQVSIDPWKNSQNKSKIHCWPPLVFPQIEYCVRLGYFVEVDLCYGWPGDRYCIFSVTGKKEIE